MKNVKGFDDIMTIMLPDMNDLENMKLPSIELYNNWMDYKERKIYLNFEIGPMLIDLATKYILRWNKEDEDYQVELKNRQPIDIYIDSPGGSLQHCLSFIDILKMSKTPIRLICLSSALSAGALIFMCKGENITRLIVPHGSVLIHQGSINAGDSQTHAFLDVAESVKKIEAKVKEYVLANTTISKQLYTRNLKKEWWIDAEEAIQLGIADKIITDISELM